MLERGERRLVERVDPDQGRQAAIDLAEQDDPRGVQTLEARVREPSHGPADGYGPPGAGAGHSGGAVNEVSDPRATSTVVSVCARGVAPP